MSEPIEHQPEAPDVIAARALAALVSAIQTDPLAAPFRTVPAYRQPRYWVFNGAINLSSSCEAAGAEQLAAARAMFGGTVKIEPGYSRDVEKHTLSTTWCGVPLTVKVDIPREDELAALRKQVAELEGAAAYRQGQLDEQRHQVQDDPAPAPSVYTAVEVTA